MNILFICHGNVARSQEAEAFLSKLDSSRTLHAASAGVEVKVGEPLDPMVLAVMQELGYDLSGATRKFINADLVSWADMIVSFKPASELPSYAAEHTHLEYWDVDDPRQQPIEFHRDVRDEIQQRVSELVERLNQG